MPALPELSVFRLPLATAGETVIQQQVGYLHLWRFERDDGSLDLDGQVTAILGKLSDQDGVPLSYNTRLQFRPKADIIRLTWSAQPSRQAVILLSANADAIEANNLPARQLVFQGQSTQTAVTRQVVTTTAGPAFVANSTRQRCIVQAPITNSDAIQIAQTNGALPDGLVLEPGASLVLFTSAGMRARALSGTQILRIMEELA